MLSGSLIILMTWTMWPAFIDVNVCAGAQRFDACCACLPNSTFFQTQRSLEVRHPGTLCAQWAGWPPPPPPPLLLLLLLPPPLQPRSATRQDPQEDLA